jgi:hypothetical protein
MTDRDTALREAIRSLTPLQHPPMKGAAVRAWIDRAEVLALIDNHPASTEASGEGLTEGIEAELAMLPPESKMRQFDMGAAAAYNHVLSLLPAAAIDPSHPTAPSTEEVPT